MTLSDSPGPLLTLRAAVILLVAVVIGGCAGVLAYLAGQPIPAAILVGGGAACAAIGLANTIIGF